MVRKLKACPFCGNKKLTGPYYSGYENKWYLRCWGNVNDQNVHDMIEFSEINKSRYSDDSTHKVEKERARIKLIRKWNTRYKASDDKRNKKRKSS